MHDITKLPYAEQLVEIFRAASGPLADDLVDIELAGRGDVSPLAFPALLATLDITECPPTCGVLYREVTEAAVWDGYWAGLLAYPDGQGYTTAALLRQLAPNTARRLCHRSLAARSLKMLTVGRRNSMLRRIWMGRASRRP